MGGYFTLHNFSHAERNIINKRRYEMKQLGQALSRLAGGVHAVGEGLKDFGSFSGSTARAGWARSLRFTWLSLTGIVFVGMGTFTLIGVAVKSSAALGVAGGILGVWAGGIAGFVAAAAAGLVIAGVGTGIFHLTRKNEYEISERLNDKLFTLGASIGALTVVAAGAITAYHVFGAAQDVFKPDPAPAATVEQVGAVHGLQKGALTDQFKNVLIVTEADRKKLGMTPSIPTQTV